MTDPRLLTQLQTYKGWLYVAVTAVLLYVLVRRSVTAIHRSAEELTFERDRLRAVVESIADPIFVCDARGTITLANPAGLALTGEAPDEAPRTLADYLAALQLCYPDGRPVPLEELAITRALGGATERGREEVGTRPGTHERIHLLISAAPLRDETGRVVGAVEVAADTTRVHELAELAERRAAQLQVILDNMVDAVFVCDADGRVVLTNAGAARMFGVATFAEVGNLPAGFPARFRLRHPGGRSVEPSETATARALQGETVVEAAQLLRRSEEEGDRHIRVSSAPIRDAEGKVVAAVTVVRDVTELTELDRLKDEFISVAAHELKTPVTIMKGYAEVLLRRVDEASPPPRKILEAIDRGADRIEAIVRDLLDVSQLHLGQVKLRMERIDLCELGSEVATRLTEASQQRHVRVLCTESVIVLGDPDRLSRVLETLVDNALRYSPAGGDVEVAVALRAGEAVISVRDQGVGIPKAKQARIFERFYRAHTGTPYDYGGMGVGLFISREIVRRHSGRMWFESQDGRGSIFSFSLPLDERHSGLGDGGAADG